MISNDSLEQVTSKDGTVITYSRRGEGPAVLVVPGALSLAGDYTPFATALAEHHFTVCVMDRRGHGQSGPQGDAYSIEKECEDVDAVLSQIKARYLVGHSFGGLATLEAARNNAAIEKVVVYEPGVSIDNSIPSGWFDEYEICLRQHKPLDAFAVFVRAMHPVFRYLPKWYFKLLMPIIFKEELKKIQDQLPANLYEHKEAVRLNNTYKNYSEITAKTLLMAGGKNKDAVKEAGVIANVIPQAEVKVYPKFDHFGIDKKGPNEVAEGVAAFFK